MAVRHSHISPHTVATFPPEMEEELKRFVGRYVLSHLISSYVDYEPVELEYTIFSCCRRQ